MAQHNQDELDDRMKAAQERWVTQGGESRTPEAILNDAIKVVSKAGDDARSKLRSGNFRMASQEQAAKESMDHLERLVLELEGLRDGGGS